MTTEIKREAFIDPMGTPMHIIEFGHGDREGNDVREFRVRMGNRELRTVNTYDQALRLIEGMGGVRQMAGDERAIAAEIGGTAVLQAALAPRVNELANEARTLHEAEKKAAEAGAKLTAAQKKAVATVEHAEAVVEAGTHVPDSQATGVMTLTTGLGGVQTHGLAERFEGAAEPVGEAVAESEKGTK